MAGCPAPGHPAVMAADMEPRRITTAEMADAYEIQALTAIESIEDPDEAERLLGLVTLAAEAVRIQKLGEDRERRWGAVRLRAERRYGELLGPAKVGAPEGNKHNAKNYVASGHIVSQTDRDTRKYARRVAAVPEEKFEGYVNTNKKPTRNGLLLESQPKPVNTQITDGQLEEIITRNLTRPEIMREFNVGEHAAQLARTKATAIAAERARVANQPKPPTGRPKNWNGDSNAKRLREIQTGKSQRSYLDLEKFQYRIAQMCTILEDYDLPNEFDATDVNLWAISAIYDDLISLQTWLDRAIMAANGWLTDHTIHEKIAKLRDTTGRSPEEAAAFLRVADMLEKKLEARLGAG